MESIRVCIDPSRLPIVVSTSDHAPEEPGRVIDVFDSDRCEANTICRLDIDGLIVRYHLESYRTGLVDLTVLHVDETHRVFLGGKSKSWVVNLATETAEYEFDHGILFWAFDLTARPGFVLELGETKCLFRQLDGRVVRSVPVAPTYDTIFERHGVRFDLTIDMYSVFLPFPDIETGDNYGPMGTSWWLDSSALPSQVWARLRVFENGSAEVLDVDAEVHRFAKAGEALSWLNEDEYSSYSDLVNSGQISKDVSTPNENIWPTTAPPRANKSGSSTD